MPTLNYGVSLSGGGVSIQQSVPRTSDGITGREVAIPHGYAGTLTTRTDDAEGEVTLDAGHAITTGMIVDIYWDGGVQHGVTVGTVATNAMPFSGGTGDVLPADETDVVVTQQVAINVDIDGDEVEIIGLMLEYADQSATWKGHCDFQESDDTQVEAIDLNANAPRIWDVAGGSDNPFSGDPIHHVAASTNATSGEGKLKILFIVDATP